MSSATPLEYSSPHLPPSRRRWPWKPFVILIALLVTVLGLIIVPVRQVESRMDAATGSMTRKTHWLFGVTSGPRLDASPLERRLKQSGIAWAPLQLLHNTHRNVFGRATCYECSAAPTIFQLRPVLKDFVAASTDAELRRFVQIMQSGTETQQQAAVDAAAEKAFDAILRGG